MTNRRPISADEPINRSARGYKFWEGWPGVNKRQMPREPRRLGASANEPNEGTIFDRMAKHLRPAPGDMTSRPTFPYPPSYRPSSMYRPKGNPGSANWRQGYSGIFRHWGLPDGYVKPFGVTVERRYVHKLIQEPYRTQHRPILLWNERPYPVFDVKTTRSLPVRPAVAYPTWNLRPYDEAKAIENARARAGMRAKARR